MVIVAKSDHEFIKTTTPSKDRGHQRKQRQADLISYDHDERDALAVAEKGLRDVQLELDIASLS